MGRIGGRGASHEGGGLRHASGRASPGPSSASGPDTRKPSNGPSPVGAPHRQTHRCNHCPTAQNVDEGGSARCSCESTGGFSNSMAKRACATLSAAGGGGPSGGWQPHAWAPTPVPSRLAAAHRRPLWGCCSTRPVRTRHWTFCGVRWHLHVGLFDHDDTILYGCRMVIMIGRMEATLCKTRP